MRPGSSERGEGQFAVDFVNTERLERGERIDALDSDRALLGWAREAGLAIEASAERRAGAGRLHRDVRPLRGAVRALFDAVLARRPPPAEALRVVNAQLTRPRPGAPLTHRRDGYSCAPAPLRTPRDILAAAARDAAGLLSSSGCERLRRCANPECIHFFVDRSRAARRRWCSMKICGNRAKVAAHQRRQREV